MKALSNLSQGVVRNTFGLYDPATKQKYEDILVSHLELRRLLVEEWLIDRKIAESKDRQKEYIVLLDFKTQRTLLRDGIIDVLVSFQRRTTGYYAVCRLWDTSRTNNIITNNERKEHETV